MESKDALGIFVFGDAGNGFRGYEYVGDAKIVSGMSREARNGIRW
jgi:hypothetical protein